MIPLCSRFDSVLFTSKRPAIASYSNFSRSQVTLPPDDYASLQPFDGDPHFQEKIDELLASERLKKKEKNALNAVRD